jgi:hypothetical protein
VVALVFQEEMELMAKEELMENFIIRLKIKIKFIISNTI